MTTIYKSSQKEMTMNAKLITMSNATIEIEARAKAFSGEGVQANRFLVEANGEVSVWDSVAGYYTTCNSLSDSAKARIRKLAELLANDADQSAYSE